MYMLTLKEWMELVDYRITEGGDYLMLSSYAYSLTSWNEDQKGWSFEIVFDTKTQIVYQVEACDYKNNRAYRLANPEYRNEVQADKKAWDDVNWIDLEVDDDFIHKCLAIKAGEDYDTRISIPLEFSDDELLILMKEAHKRDMSFNDFVEYAIMEKMEEFERDKKSKKAKKAK